MERTVPELIAAKRDGEALTPAEIQSLIRGYTDGRTPDYQLAAWAMAVFFRGMTDDETVALTLAMRDSGRTIDLGGVPGRKIDKHSTGGVGDKVSIALAPLVAACGVRVPMVSGRGLGHTGGTLDKLEAIPGFRVDLTPTRFEELVAGVGVAMAGQTRDLAPADKKLYALRDVTATVESIPLIVASILSKKLAEGIDGLVLDVKVGNGAFMKDVASARLLATALVRVAQSAGKDCVALLTRMDQPLGRAVGNALETAEAFRLLHGEGPDDLKACTWALGAEMLVMGRVATSIGEARARLDTAVRDGSAREVARKMVAAQGGDPRVVDDATLLPKARDVTAVKAPRDGVIVGIDAHAIGLAGIALGGGRTRSEDTIDPAVGLVFDQRVGDVVKAGEPVVWIHANDATRVPEVHERVTAAITFGDEADPSLPMVIERIA